MARVDTPPPVAEAVYGALAGSSGQPPVSRARRVRAILAATIGNALEWFDILIYATFATAIAATFFPAKDPTASMLAALGTFGISFFVRPVGGIVLGAYADRAGRKKALFAGMMLMMVGTALMAFTPGAATIGIAAPLLILFARMVQGFSAGGEFASATAFLAEQDPSRRAFYSSWQFASQGLAIAMAAGFGLALSAVLPEPDIASWGWRIPFAFGMLVGPVALYIRSRVPETGEFAAAPRQRPSIRQVVGREYRAILAALGAVVVCTVAVYVMLFMPVYAQRYLMLPAQTGYDAAFIAGITILVIAPLFGSLSDRVGAGRVCRAAAAVLAIVALPAFALLAHMPSRAMACLAQFVIAAPTAAYMGGIGALLATLFPPTSRTTGISIGYNVSVMIFGGMAPAALTALIASTGQLEIPGLYLALAAVLSVAALCTATVRRSGQATSETAKDNAR